MSCPSDFPITTNHEFKAKCFLVFLVAAILHLVQHHPRHCQHLHHHHHYLIVLINSFLSLCKRFWTIQTMGETIAIDKVKKNFQNMNSSILELMRVQT